jgi:hypothetical protein
MGKVRPVGPFPSKKKENALGTRRLACGLGKEPRSLTGIHIINGPGRPSGHVADQPNY